MNTLSADQQQQLLSDPKVQEMVKKAGADALSDPAVQKQLMDTCKEKFPELAGQAADQLKAWANDPAVQAQAKACAGVAMAYVAGAGDAFMKQIEQGPAGVRVLAFLTSLASASLAVFDLINPLQIFGHIIMYMIACYQFIFAMTTVLFEVPPEWHVKFQEKTGFPVSSYQDLLINNAKFLALNGGRGIFYLFQGTLWLAFASMTEFLDLGVGCALVFIGLLHILMHFGILPQDVAKKMRSGYEQVKGTAAGSSAAQPLNP